MTPARPSKPGGAAPLGASLIGERDPFAANPGSNSTEQHPVEAALESKTKKGQILLFVRKYKAVKVSLSRCRPRHAWPVLFRRTATHTSRSDIYITELTQFRPSGGPREGFD